MPTDIFNNALNIGRRHHQAGRLAEAERIYRQVLAQQPEHAEALHLLGVVAHQVGRNDAALVLLQQAISRDPSLARAHNNFSSVLIDLGRLDEAIDALSRAIALKPDLAEAHANLAIAFFKQEKFAQAAAAAEKAVQFNPALANAKDVLGAVLREQGRLAEAISFFRKTIGAHPDHAPAYSNLAYALLDQGKVDEAIAACRSAIALKPDLAAAHLTLGNALKECGLLDEALAANARAMALAPDNPMIHGNRLYALHFHPAYDRAAIHDENRKWNQLHAQPLKKFIEPHTNIRDPDRRLKVGYVSPDFCGHPVGRFILPLIERHDREKVEVFHYADVRVPDSLTARLQSHAGVWRDIAGMSHANVARRIREDGIDILVDLTLHMDNNRLLVFARKPAPVQVSYLAYCSTTGLETMDYRLTDSYLDPLEWGNDCYSEQSVRLPRTYWSYEPHADSSPVATLPALKDGRITFGCLNNFCKVSSGALQTWGKLLAEIPGSRLLLHASEGSHRQRVLNSLQEQGVQGGRVQFVGRVGGKEYFQLYNGIDIALDPFPCAGGTTTCDALWMGVPVVSLAGATAVGRSGVSLLTNVGLPQLIAQSPQEYAHKAGELAGNLPDLAQLRAGLRDRMRKSPLMDAPRFAADVESAFRRMWREWCATDGV